MSVSLVWLRNDLRTDDHPALSAARARGSVVAVYCLCVGQWRQHDMSDWRLAFQMRALHNLAARLEALGVPLRILDTGTFAAAPAAVLGLAQDIGASHLEFIEEYPLDERRRDKETVRLFKQAGLAVQRHAADALVRPGTLRTAKEAPYTVFTPFYRKWLTQLPDTKPLPEIEPQAGLDIESDTLPATLDGVALNFGADLWPAEPDRAHARLQDFVGQAMEGYPEQRDLPAVDGTSMLSAHLAVGTLSAHQALDAVGRATAGGSEGARSWVAELAWRDFYRHIVALFDRVSFGHNFRVGYEALPWRDAPADLRAWQQGNTGYPLVDAAMRQLNETGWMHNRLRMVSAMFLTKHLLIDWREGERYFMRNLIDGDFASNNGGWQWSASTGTDAAPYFRIFNPASQGQRFDPDGVFTRRYVPELGDVPAKNLYEPHRGGGVAGYPAPIVDHKFARQRALDAFKALG
ncbi:MAG: deoxyribodipyrimidine photo-lyase [Pseudomonadota bacterium]